MKTNVTAFVVTEIYPKNKIALIKDLRSAFDLSLHHAKVLSELNKVNSETVKELHGIVRVDIDTAYKLFQKNGYGVRPLEAAAKMTDDDVVFAIHNHIKNAVDAYDYDTAILWINRLKLK